MMGEVTSIAWTTHTFNPWIGCSRVNAGCARCYAEADMDKRRHFAQWGPHGTRVRTSDANWRKPIKWNKEAEAAGVRKRVFCASLADVFEDWQGLITTHKRQRLWVSDKEPGRYHAEPFAGFESLSLTQCDLDNIANGPYRPATMIDLRADLFRLIDKTPWLDWQLLTKRPENIRRTWPDFTTNGQNKFADYCYQGVKVRRENVWLGTSISDQPTADTAIPELLKCRDLSPVLFLSVEPLLGPVDLMEHAYWHCPACRADLLFKWSKCDEHDLSIFSPGIDWVIVGGESGTQARPCRVEWIRDIVGQCDAAAVPCFVKQLGAWPMHSGDSAGAWAIRNANDPKHGDPDKWPEDLRVRQFPKVRAT